MTQLPPANHPAAPTHPSATPAPRRPRREHQLVATLKALAGGHGTLRRHEERSWASVTFAGARHRLVLEFSGDDAIVGGDQLIALAPDHEFTLRGELVADLAICEVIHSIGPPPVLRVTIEALLLSES